MVTLQWFMLVFGRKCCHYIGSSTFLKDYVDTTMFQASLFKENADTTFVSFCLFSLCGDFFKPISNGSLRSTSISYSQKEEIAKKEPNVWKPLNDVCVGCDSHGKRHWTLASVRRLYSRTHQESQDYALF